jgi:hypothetical protein
MFKTWLSGASEEEKKKAIQGKAIYLPRPTQTKPVPKAKAATVAATFSSSTVV